MGDGTYHDGNRELQERFDTRRLADRIDERLVVDALDEETQAFIARQDLFFLATADAGGRPQCSYKGGAPGFVRVLDPRTLAFPSYDGNGMFLSLGNILANPHVGLLFIDFETQARLRVNGVAELDDDEALRATWPEAHVVVRVRVAQVFPNCSRYVHRAAREERSAFVPTGDAKTPVPAWKGREWARDTLPAGDPARDPTREVRER